MNTVRIGLLGCGVVGSALVELLRRNGQLVLQRSGVDVRVQRALVRSIDRGGRPAGLPLTTQPKDVIEADDIDVVVEVMGGLDPAGDYVRQALARGKHVVTANKALLATHGRELFELAAKRNCHVGFEASVCGAIPIIGALRQGLVGNRITALCGIVNGTTNFILSQMASKQVDFVAALGAAQRLGFCEADASFDLDGIDAAQKLVLLSALAFGVDAQVSDVQTEGISHIEAEDIAQARRLGFSIKHVARAERSDDTGGVVDLRVHPALVPDGHPLAAVQNEYNAVVLTGDAAGDMIYFGKGAGGAPTASAVLCDIVDVARRRDTRPFVAQAKQIAVGRTVSSSRFYLRLPILDRPGAIGVITTALGEHGVSIEHAQAVLVDDAGSVVIVTHRCGEQRLRGAVAAIRAQRDLLRGPPVVLGLLEERREEQQDSRAPRRTPTTVSASAAVAASL